MIINVKTSGGSYNITLKRNALNEVNKILNIKGKALILTDRGVPRAYIETIDGVYDTNYTIIQNNTCTN